MKHLYVLVALVFSAAANDVRVPSEKAISGDQFPASDHGSVSPHDVRGHRRAENQDDEGNEEANHEANGEEMAHHEANGEEMLEANEKSYGQPAGSATGSTHQVSGNQQGQQGAQASGNQSVQVQQQQGGGGQQQQGGGGQQQQGGGGQQQQGGGGSCPKYPECVEYLVTAMNKKIDAVSSSINDALTVSENAGQNVSDMLTSFQSLPVGEDITNSFQAVLDGLQASKDAGSLARKGLTKLKDNVVVAMSGYKTIGDLSSIADIREKLSNVGISISNKLETIAKTFACASCAPALREVAQSGVHSEDEQGAGKSSAAINLEATFQRVIDQGSKVFAGIKSAARKAGVKESDLGPLDTLSESFKKKVFEKIKEGSPSADVSDNDQNVGTSKCKVAKAFQQGLQEMNST